MNTPTLQAENYPSTNMKPAWENVNGGKFSLVEYKDAKGVECYSTPFLLNGGAGWCTYIKTGYLLYIKTGEKLYFVAVGYVVRRSSKGYPHYGYPCSILSRPHSLHSPFSIL